ncbi:uncharacterized protein LOC120350176 [Nilaparvata lugens]|uniref:uncharacterized protein LOC120350176 n=1 Tax=Nilaparvata lugens TaxID=108931 RepID=UPI00193DD1CC|nr:uncharacterized protein LOC120350176 [Nilaparvata lugens]
MGLCWYCAALRLRWDCGRVGSLSFTHRALCCGRAVAVLLCITSFHCNHFITSVTEMDSDEEDVIIAVDAFIVLQDEEEETKRPKYWMHQLWKARDEDGEFHTIFSRLKSDPVKFSKYFRMILPKFENLSKILENDLTKQHSRWRRPVSPEERLALILKLKYLGSGNSQLSNQLQLIGSFDSELYYFSNIGSYMKVYGC